MRGTLVQLNVSPGGMPKIAVPSAIVTRTGVAGDRQRNRKLHGGPDRAICLYSVELYDWLREEGIDLQWGSIGENLTTHALDLNELSIGTQLRIGQTIIEITKVRVPCRNLHKWDPRLMELIRGRSGWMAKVIQEGIAREGDEIEVM
jgi:MOSC domain-containing protein YiiM